MLTMLLMGGLGIALHFLGRWGEHWRTVQKINAWHYVQLDPPGWLAAAAGSVGFCWRCLKSTSCSACRSPSGRPNGLPAGPATWAPALGRNCWRWRRAASVSGDNARKGANPSPVQGDGSHHYCAGFPCHAGSTPTAWATLTLRKW